MEVSELKAKTEELENKISTFISQEINKFLVETGVGFNGLHVYLTDLRTMSQTHSLYLVSTDINLDL